MNTDKPESSKDSSAPDQIRVEVAYALPDKQKIIALTVEQGSTALHTAEQSGIASQFDNIDLETAKMGVFGKAVKPASYIMREGDRVEIYRPLLVDPKQARKARAEKAAADKP